MRRSARSSAWLLGAVPAAARASRWAGHGTASPSLLALNAPVERRGLLGSDFFSARRPARVPGCERAVLVLPAQSLGSRYFLDWGWRYPFFCAFTINVVAVVRAAAARRDARVQALVRQVASCSPRRRSRPCSAEWRTILLGAFAPLASFALFHLVAVFPLSCGQLFTHREPGPLPDPRGGRSDRLRAVHHGVGLHSADRVGRRAVLGVSCGAVAAYSGFAPQPARRRTAWRGRVHARPVSCCSACPSASRRARSTAAFPRCTDNTRAAIVANSAWFIGAGLLGGRCGSRAGTRPVGRRPVPAASGVICTLVALAINRDWGQRDQGTSEAPVIAD